MIKWEYKVIERRKVSKETTEEITKADIDYLKFTLPIDELNKIGSNGWELVIYCPDVGTGSPPVAIFKRPKN